MWDDDASFHGVPIIHGFVVVSSFQSGIGQLLSKESKEYKAANFLPISFLKRSKMLSKLLTTIGVILMLHAAYSAHHCKFKS